MASSPVPPWQLQGRETVYDTRWLAVCRDQVVRPDGADYVYDHVLLPASTTILALRDDGMVPVTHQWIYTHRERHWRLPSGGVDRADADPAAAARRELREETGLTAGVWEVLGSVNGADSVTNHRDHVFMATDLTTAGHPQLEGGEADLEVHWMCFSTVLEFVLNGRMVHAGSAFAVLTAALRRSVSTAGTRLA